MSDYQLQAQEEMWDAIAAQDRAAGSTSGALPKGTRVYMESETPSWKTGDYPRSFGTVAVPLGAARVARYRDQIGISFDDGGFKFHPAYRVRRADQ